MEKSILSPQLLHKRKFLLVLPVLVFPFVTLLFWALGGGKANVTQSHAQMVNKGLNMELPDAYLKDDHSLDKLSYYEKAAADSTKLGEQMQKETYYTQYNDDYASGLLLNTDTFRSTTMQKQKSLGGSSHLNLSPYSNKAYTDPNEAKVYKKLEELNTVLNHAAIQQEKVPAYSELPSNSNSAINKDDIDRLEQMIDLTSENSKSEDPEMKQINGMMEKILDIQHPERVKEKVRQTSEKNKGRVFTVEINDNKEPASLLVKDRSSTNYRNVIGSDRLAYNRFFSLDDDSTGNIVQQNAIPAVIHESGTLVDGAMVKLRLLNDVYINGTLIPKNSFVYGMASISGERLNIKIGSIRYNNMLFPVKLSVVDMDGVDGIYIPGAITPESVKQSAERTAGGIGINTLNPSLGLQAASAGIEAAKTLLSKKAKMIKVLVKAGYQVLLRDEKEEASF